MINSYRRKSLFIVIMALLVMVATALPAAAASETGARRAVVERHAPNVEALMAKAQSDGKVRVIVKIDLSQMAGGTSSIAQAQSEVEGLLSSTDAETTARFRTIPFIGLEVTPEALEALANSPMIMGIEEDKVDFLQLASSTAVIDADLAWAAGYTGTDQTVAILDTGIQADHPFFGGRVVKEACYSDNLCPLGDGTSGAGAAAVTLCGNNLCSHGTHVAGIAAGSGGSYSGVAKDANILAVQVFSRFTSGCAGGAWECVGAWRSDQILGLEYVYSQRLNYSIAAINISIGGGLFSSTCDAESSAYFNAVTNLRNAGIAVIAAAGNDGSGSQISFPACMSNMIVVGSTNDIDEVSYFTNSNNLIDFWAPGEAIDSSIPGSGYGSKQGTSMATPHVVGAWAVLKAASPSATITDIYNALYTTGVAVTDPLNAVTRPRIDLDNALSGAATPTTFTVNSTNDVNDGVCNVSHCSLREAIIAANSRGSRDTIAFNIAGAGPHIIQPTASLPTITNHVIINGTTEPDYAGTPMIVLNGASAGNVNGLTLSASRSEIRGLVIQSFQQSGIVLSGDAFHHSVVAGNYIGTDVTGAVDTGNGGSGIVVTNSYFVTIGGTTAADRNVISGNNQHGIMMTGATADNNLIVGNYIGTNAAGTADLGNTNQGIFLQSTEFTTIGGTTASARNVISGNDGNGLYFNSAHNVAVKGNYIGLNAAGTAAIGNTSHGIGVYRLVGSSTFSFTIGGLGGGHGNVISGNGGDGIHIQLDSLTPAEVSAVYGNFIGTNAAGTADLGNTAHGVFLNASGVKIGYGFTGLNVISGNGGSGISISGDNNSVSNNHIGTDVNGTADLGNDGDGIVLIDGAQSNGIGGVRSIYDNVISGNGGSGIVVDGITTSGNIIVHNYIGITETGNPLGNSQHGIYLSNGASNNRIGTNAYGDNYSNTIAYNGLNGVTIDTSSALNVNYGQANRLNFNVIYANGALGIDINYDGVTANDANDVDQGANSRQNYPLMVHASSETANGFLYVSGTLNSSPNTTYRLEFFRSAACDPSGYGEGEIFVQSLNVTTNGSGNATYSEVIGTYPINGIVGQGVTVTATDPSGNTSEFSDCETVALVPAFPSPTNVTATALTPSSIQISWTDNTSDETHFYIARAINGFWTDIGSVAGVSGTGSTVTFTETLTCGQMYHFKVRAYRSDHMRYSYYSGSTASIQTECPDLTPPSVPTLSTPTNASMISDTTPSFDWSDSTGSPTQYQIVVDDNADYSSPVIDTTVATSTHTAASEMPYATYYWRVRARDAAGNWSNWTSSFSFNLADDSLGNGYYEQENSYLTYSGNWELVLDAAASGGSFRRTNDPNAYVTFLFTGTRMTLYTLKFSNRGSMEICIDTTNCSNFNANSPSLIWQFPVVFNVSAGKHTVKIRNLSGSFIDVDAIRIETPGTATPTLTPTVTTTPTQTATVTTTPTVTATATTPPGGGLPNGYYEQENAALTYSGSWQLVSDAAASGGTFRRTNDPNAFVTFTFTGTRMTLYTLKFSNRGSMEICLDVSNCTTFNANSASLIWQFPVERSVSEGTHTVKIRNLSGAYIDVDAIRIETIGTATPTLTPTVTTTPTQTATPTNTPTVTATTPPGGGLTNGYYEQENAALTYSGSWQLISDGSASGGTFRRTNDPNAFVTFTFTGTRMTLYTLKFSNRGSMEICLDVSNCTTFNANSASLVWQFPVERNVSDGTHTVKIRNLSGAYIDVDAIRIETIGTATPTLTPTVTTTPTQTATPTNTPTVTATTPPGGGLTNGYYEQENAALTYSGSWQLISDGSASGGTFRRTNDPNAFVTFTFTGTRMTLYTLKFSNRGSMEICIDVSNCTTFNANSASLVWQFPVERNVSDGTHTVKIRNLSGAYIDVDAIRIETIGTAIPTVTTTPTQTATVTTTPTVTATATTPSGGGLTNGYYEQENAALTYSGSWQLISDAGASGGSFRRTNDPNAFVTFTFTGTRMTLYTLKFSNRGSMEICLDVSNCTTFNANSASLVWQFPVERNVSDGTHTVKIRNLSSAYIDVDAIRIETIGTATPTLTPTVTTTPTQTATVTTTPTVTATATTPPGGGLPNGYYEQENVALTYSGSWQLISDAAASGGTFRRTNDPSAFVTFTFTGTRMTLYTLKFSNRGSMEICLDVSNCTTFNANSASLVWQFPVERNVSEGTHTVKIRNLSGAYIDVDAVRIETIGTATPTVTPTQTVTPTATTPPGGGLPNGYYEQENVALTFSGSWQLISDPGASGGSFRRTNDPNAFVTFSFSGTRMTLYTLKFSNRGSMEICIDVSNCTTFNANSASLIWQFPVERNVGNATHTVKIRNLSGAYIDVDAVRIETIGGGSSEPSVSRYTKVDWFWLNLK